jgi:hypothetical protein
MASNPLQKMPVSREFQVEIMHQKYPARFAPIKSQIQNTGACGGNGLVVECDVYEVFPEDFIPHARLFAVSRPPRVFGDGRMVGVAASAERAGRCQFPHDRASGLAASD